MQSNFYHAEKVALFSSGQSKLHSGNALLQRPADFSAGEACSGAGLSRSPAAHGQ